VAERYAQTQRDRVFTRDFIARLHNLGAAYPREYIATVHVLLAALLESEAELRGLRDENASLWAYLATVRERGQ
jgi:hypothetical protein